MTITMLSVAIEDRDRDPSHRSTVQLKNRFLVQGNNNNAAAVDRVNEV